MSTFLIQPISIIPIHIGFPQHLIYHPDIVGQETKIITLWGESGFMVSIQIIIGIAIIWTLQYKIYKEILPQEPLLIMKPGAE